MSAGSSLPYKLIPGAAKYRWQLGIVIMNGSPCWSLQNTGLDQDWKVVVLIVNSSGEVQIAGV